MSESEGLSAQTQGLEFVGGHSVGGAPLAVESDMAMPQAAARQRRMSQHQHLGRGTRMRLAPGGLVCRSPAPARENSSKIQAVEVDDAEWLLRQHGRRRIVQHDLHSTEAWWCY